MADIPANPNKNAAAAGGEPASNLKNSKRISRSISLLTPFKSKQGTAAKGQQHHEVVYDSAGNQVQNGSGGGKPPRPPQQARKGPPPTGGHNNGTAAVGGMAKEKKFASSSDLLREEREGVVMVAPLKDPAPVSSKVSRSVSMPKDTRLAGWFKKRKRV